MELHSLRSCRLLYLLNDTLGSRVVRVHQQGDHPSPRYSTAKCCPSMWPASLSPLRNAAINGSERLGDPVLRTPITGIAFCCARAASGHAAIAPARSATNFRRLMEASPSAQTSGEL